jgi:hypothetical protein
MNFKIDNTIASELCIDDLIDLQDGKVKPLRDVLSKFAYSDGGVKIEPEEAKKLIGKMKIDEMRDLSEKFQAAVKEATANPTNESS